MGADDKRSILPAEHDAMPEGEEPPPRGVKTMAAVRWVIVVVAAALAAFMWLSYARTQLSTARPGEAVAKPKYHCPMHPQIVSDQPGECPICHMTLEPIAGGRGAPVPAEGPSKTQGAGDAGPLDAAAIPGSLPAGTTSLKLALDRIQSIGVRTAVAEERSLSSTLRVTAIVMPPERGVSEVHVRTPGFVEAIRVDQTGVVVRAGQSMLSVYSPEVLQAQNELLATSEWKGDAGAASSSSARRKLELLGMSTAEVDQVIAKRESLRAVSVTTPGGGFVTKKNVVLGSYVTPEMTLYEIQDLSRVYVVADVFLGDVGGVTVGMAGRFVPSSQPERAITGKVDLIYPVISPDARTRRIRMQVPSEGMKTYAPGEYGILEVAATGSRRGVSIPRDALIETGTASYLFVVEADARFTPRVVSISGGDADHVIVVDGLHAGERVVSGATFLIDSESRLQASIAQAVQAQPSPSPAPTGGEEPSCDTDFDRQKAPDKWADCRKCEAVHRGMGSMVSDCKRAISKPWTSP